MKTKLLPAIIMLTAGAIDCVLSIVGHVDAFTFTLRLLVVLVVFYVIGSVVRLIVDINFPQMKDEPEAGEETPEENEQGQKDEDTGTDEAAEELENINADNESE